MPNIKQVTAKIGNMRKPQTFVVYPSQNDEFLRIQSDTIYAKVLLSNGVGVYANRPNGAYAHDLIFHGRAVTIEPTLLQQFKDAIAKPGERIGAGCYVG